MSEKRKLYKTWNENIFLPICMKIRRDNNTFCSIQKNEFAEIFKNLVRHRK